MPTKLQLNFIIGSGEKGLAERDYHEAMVTEPKPFKLPFVTFISAQTSKFGSKWFHGLLKEDIYNCKS